MLKVSTLKHAKPRKRTATNPDAGAAALRDSERLTAWLRDTVSWPAGTSLEHVAVHRLWAGRRGRITFELALQLRGSHGDDIRMLQGRVGPVRAADHKHTRASLSRGGLFGLRIASDSLQLACWTPDKDRKLPAVRELLKEPGRRRLLAGTAAGLRLHIETTGTASGGRIHSDVVAYRAHKRCVLRLRGAAADGAPSVFVKVLRRPQPPSHAATLCRLAAQLAEFSDGRVRVVPVLDALDEGRLLVTAGVGDARGAGDPEQPSSATLRSGAQDAPSVYAGMPIAPHGPSGAFADDEVDAAAETLACIHATPDVGDVDAHGSRDEFRTACKWVSVLRRLHFPENALLRRLVVRLAGMVPGSAEAGRTLLHRDFHGTQLLRSGSSYWITDFDTLTRGHAEVDVSTYLAHLLLDAVTRQALMRVATDLPGRFLSTYQSRGGRLDKTRLRFYLPCAMARLGAIHRVRGLDPIAVEAFWDWADAYRSGDRKL